MRNIHRKLGTLVFSVRESCASAGWIGDDPPVARWNSGERWATLLVLRGSASLGAVRHVLDRFGPQEWILSPLGRRLTS